MKRAVVNGPGFVSAEPCSICLHTRCSASCGRICRFSGSQTRPVTRHQAGAAVGRRGNPSAYGEPAVDAGGADIPPPIVEIAYEVDFDFPFRTRPHLNPRGTNWCVTHRKKLAEREALYFAWIAAGRPVPPVPATITFVRIAPRPLDEGDNLPSAFKAMRDELAKRLGVNDDRTAPVTWLYAQERGAPRYYGVRVEMRGTLRRLAR